MLGFLKGIFSAPKAVDAGLDLVKSGVSGIDKLFFTEEEKSDARRNWFKLWLEGQKITASENTTRSVTRRILAVSIVGEFLLFILMAGIAWPWMKGWAMFLLELAQSLGNLVLLVAGFYFGVHLLRGWKEKGN